MLIGKKIVEIYERNPNIILSRLDIDIIDTIQREVNRANVKSS